MINRAPTPPACLPGELSGTFDSCLTAQLILFVHIADMLADDAQVLPEQLRQLLLREPDGLAPRKQRTDLCATLAAHKGALIAH